MAAQLDGMLLDEYRRKRALFVLSLMAIWFAVSILGIWMAGALDTVAILGLPFGYWLGAQGSVVVFIAEVFSYAAYMDRLDRRYGLTED